MWEAWETPNLDGASNYLILEAEGPGHYVGCHVDIDCFSRQANDWYGEGDDMIFIDGEPLPRLRGTGTEDYFNTAYAPTQDYHAPYHGLILYQGTDDWRWRGKIRCTATTSRTRSTSTSRSRHDRARPRQQADVDYSSTAYWYQTEPHSPSPLLPVTRRSPRL